MAKRFRLQGPIGALELVDHKLVATSLPANSTLETLGESAEYAGMLECMSGGRRMLVFATDLDLRAEPEAWKTAS